MHKLNYLITLLTLFVCNVAKAQFPNNDAAWVPQTSLSDEFDSTAVKLNKWNTNYWGSSDISNGAEINYASNLLSNSSTLKIKADTLKPNVTRAWGTFPDYGYGTSGQPLTFAYQGGVIQSKTSNYKFGYVEISAKFPSKKYSLWPAFWLMSSDCNTSGAHFLNEIDIAENGAVQSFQGNHVGNNYHIGDTTCNYDYAINNGFDVSVLADGDSLSGVMHTYALEWDPHSVTWYFDGKPTSQLYSATGAGLPQNGMGLLLNFCIQPQYAFLPANWNGAPVTPHGNNLPTKWPQTFEIDYVHYYKLVSDCSTDAVICSASIYDRKVKKTISTNTACTPTYSPSTAANSFTLRATDYILLNAGFTSSPTGTGYFAAETLACPQ